MLLTVLAYNEEKEIASVIENYKDSFEEVLIVNDCSIDETGNILEKIKSINDNITIINNEKNLGAGKSLLQAIEYFKDSSHEYLIKIDGDNQFRKKDVLETKELLKSNKYDFIKGDRFWINGIDGQIPLIRYVGNTLASFLIKFSTGNWKLNDPLNGLFGFSKVSLKNFYLPSLFNRYGYPFYLNIFYSKQSLVENSRLLQIENQISYGSEKSSLKPFVLFFKLIYFSLISYFKKIFLKIKYSNLQMAALLDIFFVGSFIFSIYAFIKFYLIRFYSISGPQYTWLGLSVFFIFIGMTSFITSQKIESKILTLKFTSIKNED